ncbi:hypothetical protein TSMEX_001555 [Taenia solium]|eukprot:TsM_000584900 transcript=TsM_000584900 gene=TsM_000584900
MMPYHLSTELLLSLAILIPQRAHSTFLGFPERWVTSISCLHGIDGRCARSNVTR